ncbi:hypothetical protein NHP21005_16410 [Helicobacter sp. NHP21005]|uniref:hypothetical protein n=1 Tax=Helicobacter felistomachi TaxID=3040201 RepID=UPI002573BA31|nr:hypothetical protein [Helicobacter sp. NHP21005]BEG57953.1 hypothetical protein NHP21005_16410 [Helicobacter sp. NHP21005]
MFRCFLESAQEAGELELVAFLGEVLSIYDQHGINGHVLWKKAKSGHRNYHVSLGRWHNFNLA